jgi:glutathione synthase
MKIGFFINDVQMERPEYTTVCLARAAIARGHRVWFIGVNDFAFDPDDNVRARARAPSKSKYKSNEKLLEDVQRADAPVERITVAELDVLLLRNNPAEDVAERPWAQSSGIIFGRLAERQGVLVLNDPYSLASALNKLYFQLFPKEIRPSTLITRDRHEIRTFVEAHEMGCVLKPLQGSGGQNVFRVKADDMENLNQIIDAIHRDGYVVVQEYLPAAAEGDLRLILVNGQPLQCEGRFAAIRRVNAKGDLRSNIHAGGEAQPAEVSDAVLQIAEMVRPKLLQDGMFFVGLDVAGDKLMEVNVFSPGGLYSMERFEKVPFSARVIEVLEQKVRIRCRYGADFSNVELATM